QRIQTEMPVAGFIPSVTGSKSFHWHMSTSPTQFPSGSFPKTGRSYEAVDKGQRNTELLFTIVNEAIRFSLSTMQIKLWTKAESLF
ncbi:hypothetical protein JRQ81_006164, partial [Phrynocephalus forsythii]